jgi:hypothetical protein
MLHQHGPVHGGQFDEEHPVGATRICPESVRLVGGDGCREGSSALRRAFVEDSALASNYLTIRRDARLIRPNFQKPVGRTGP